MDHVSLAIGHTPRPTSARVKGPRLGECENEAEEERTVQRTEETEVRQDAAQSDTFSITFRVTVSKDQDKPSVVAVEELSSHADEGEATRPSKRQRTDTKEALVEPVWVEMSGKDDTDDCR